MPASRYEAVELASYPRVASVVLEDLRVEPLPELEGGMRRVREQSLEVRVLDRERAARPHRRPHATQQVERPLHVLEEEAGIHDVVCLWLVPLADVGAPELDVRDARLGGVRARELELHLVHVDPDCPAGRTDEPGELHGDGAAAAAEVEARLPGPDPHVGEELRRLGPPDPGEELKPFVPLASAADDVAGHGRRLLAANQPGWRSMIDDPGPRCGRSIRVASTEHRHF